MIRYWIYILFLSLFLFSCKNKRDFSMKTFINQNNLQNPKIKYNQGIESHIFLNKDSEDKSLLLVIENRDTLYSQIGYYNNLLKNQTFKKENNYFIRFNNFNNYDKEKDTNAIKMYSFYHINKINNSLTPIKSIDKVKILENFKKVKNILQDLQVIQNEQSISYYINGDIFVGGITIFPKSMKTTRESIVYHGSTVFSLKKNNKGEFEFSTNNKELYNSIELIDGQVVSKEFVGSNKTQSFNIYTKSYSDFDKYYNPTKKNRYEIIVSINNITEKILKSIDEKELFKLNSRKEKELNAGVVSEFRPDFFNYGIDYFITTFLANSDEYSEQFPPLYHLDTINWKIDPVSPLFDNMNEKMTETRTVELLSGDTNNRVTKFLKNYEIVKVENKFQLIKTKQ